jgi:hypothetical protein
MNPPANEYMPEHATRAADDHHSRRAGPSRAQKRPAFIDDRRDGGEGQSEAAGVRSGPFWFVLEQS